MAHDAKDDRPKQVEENDKVHHLHSLPKRPHSRRSVLDINDLCSRNSSGGGLIPDHQRALEDHGLPGELPYDREGAKFVAGAHKPIQLASYELCTFAIIWE